jgi:cell division protein FtsI (penicillin-binding protein 3)
MTGATTTWPDRAGETNSEMDASLLTIGRKRLGLVAIFFGLAFVVISARLIELTWQGGAPDPTAARENAARGVVDRASIVDRNGVVLATSLRSASLYANPGKVMDVPEAVRRLARVLPDLSKAEISKKLSSERSFVWLKRNLSPKQQWQVNELGLPGLAFQQEHRRVYPHGPIAAHALGFVDIDNNGIAGIERYFDDELRALAGDGEPLVMSLDVRIQHTLRSELNKGRRSYRAKGAAGIVLNVRTGEILALSSLPDFDPNHASAASRKSLFNRATLGVYELGSVFKTFTTAMALDTGVVKLSGGYDATKPLRVDRHVIHDDHAKKRWLSVPEIFMYSSNIGSAKMAMDVGKKRQRQFLDRLGLTQKPVLELPEVGSPLVPDPWRNINTLTASYGHGIAISPLQLASAAAAIVNGGRMIPATLLKRDVNSVPEGEQVVSAKTSAMMRRLLRLVVEKGTGRKANAPGYLVGGKTGTAEKPGTRGYRRDALISSFVADFPSDDPEYLVLVMYDEPKGNALTEGFAGAGWTAAPVARRVIERIAPILGVQPVPDLQGNGGDVLVMANG